MHQGFDHSTHYTPDETKLVLPGMRSKTRLHPPTLDRLDSGLTSPCVSDQTMTNRRIRENLPCTPSPMYAYDSSYAYGSVDGHLGVVPRFFPFVYTDNHIVAQPKVTRYNSNDAIVDDECHIAFSRANSLRLSTCAQSKSPPSANLLISPKQLRKVSNTISTPLGTQSSECLSEPDDPSSYILKLLKNSIGSNGSFDLSDMIIDKTQIIEHIVDISKDQAGSRYVQQLLDSRGALSPNEINEIYTRILPDIRQLALDQFGNYVIQKIMDELPEPCLSSICDQLSGNFFTYSTHMYGCRVVQRLIETATLSRLFAITEEMKNHVIECVEDQNGNHVIQKLIERLPIGEAESGAIRSLLGQFIGHVPRLAIHCYGCRVVQRLIEKLKPLKDCLQILISEILANLWQLSQDQYGNYVIQHVLVHGHKTHRSVVVQVIASHIIEFSCHKYASNIAEKALLCSNDQISRDLIIAAVIGSGDPESPLFVLMKDRFANYVIQRCLEFSHGHQRQLLIGILQANLNSLKGVIYGKHIATAIERIISSPSQSKQ
jgi:hypothetical protein